MADESPVIRIVACHDPACILADVAHDHVLIPEDETDPNNKEEPTMAQSQPTTAQSHPVDEFRKAADHDADVNDVADAVLAGAIRVMSDFEWLDNENAREVLGVVAERIHRLRNSLYEPKRSIDGDVF